LREKQQALVTAWLEKVALAGQQAGAREIGAATKAAINLNWQLVNQDARQWATQYGYELIDGITDTTRARMQTALDEWITAGEPLSRLTERVTAIFNDPQRAAAIAATESTRAYAEGNNQVWQAAGVPEREWRTAVDERVCPVCGALHQKRAKLGTPFEVTVKGKRVVVDNPPAHPHCRCAILPVVRPERSPTPGTNQERIVIDGREITVARGYRPGPQYLSQPELYTLIGDARLTGERRQHYRTRHPETSRLSASEETQLLEQILQTPALRAPDPKSAQNERRYVQDTDGKWWRAVVGKGQDGQWFVLSFQRVHGPGK